IPSADITIKLDASITSVVFVFIAAFERHLDEKSVVTFSEIMAGLMYETLPFPEQTRRPPTHRPQIPLHLAPPPQPRRPPPPAMRQAQTPLPLSNPNSRFAARPASAAPSLPLFSPPLPFDPARTQPRPEDLDSLAFKAVTRRVRSLLKTGDLAVANSLAKT